MKYLFLSAAMRPLSAALALLVATGLGQAATVTTADILANWTQGPEPTLKSTDGTWVSAGGALSGTGNHRGAITSDVIAVGDFSFGASYNPNDNDTFGMVFGWQDIDNHYRISWATDYGENGANPNSAGSGSTQRGFKIIKVAADVRTVLYSSATTYSSSANYSLLVEAQLGGGFEVTVNNLTSPALVVNQVIADTMFTSGKVGFFHLYEDLLSSWSNVDLTQGTAAVPVPMSLPLMASGFGLLAFAMRRRRS